MGPCFFIFSRIISDTETTGKLSKSIFSKDRLKQGFVHILQNFGREFILQQDAVRVSLIPQSSKIKKMEFVPANSYPGLY